MKHKINLVFEELSIRRLTVPAIIRTCIQGTLKAEGVKAPCEINVLITDDAGIRTVNRESRNIDSPTDVLSFPMFSFTPGKLPEDWGEYLDPETGLCPLGDMCISLERAQAQAHEAAGADGVEGLDNLESGALRVRPGVLPGRNTG